MKGREKRKNQRELKLLEKSMKWSKNIREKCSGVGQLLKDGKLN